jgi:periplasmic divalent cation tolerance protein
MRSAAPFRLVLVTAPNVKTARQLARAALEGRLVACANLIPRIESHYWWQGKIEKSPEVLIIFKTSARRLARLERLILEKHPYDTPEFIEMKLTRGTERYLAWLTRETT